MRRARTSPVIQSTRNAASRARAWRGPGWGAAMIVLASCSPAEPDAPRLRATSGAQARAVVEELIDAGRRADARATAERLCPAEPDGVGAVLKALLEDGGAVVGRAHPAWAGDVPTFLVEVRRPQDVGEARRRAVVRAREGCVTHVVDLAAASQEPAPPGAPVTVDGTDSTASNPVPTTGADAGVDEIEL